MISPPCTECENGVIRTRGMDNTEIIDECPNCVGDCIGPRGITNLCMSGNCKRCVPWHIAVSEVARRFRDHIDQMVIDHLFEEFGNGRDDC